MSSAKHAPKGDGLLPKELAESATKFALGLAAVGVLAGGAGAATDLKRFGAAYLIGFLFSTTIGLGALFFVLIQHLTRAGWSVAPRRIMEWLSQGLIASIALFIPLVLMSHDIWHHWMHDPMSDPVLAKKVAYLNPSFFYARAAVFLVTWAGLAHWFYKLSREQDATGDRKLSSKLQAYSAPAVLAFALTSSFAGFDWVMTLDPHWYSTIFGVYIFAGALTSAWSVLSLIIVKLRNAGVGGDLLTVEHQHDVGKFLFGFVVFWAYIGFSQFMLIYYANIPEETVWYRHRWEHGWSTVSMVLFIGHFVAPFLILLSRTAKRTNSVLATGAILLLVMHFVDLYWLVMPNFEFNHHFTPSWIDIAGLLAPVGITAAWIAKRVLGDPIIPLKDPYVPEALKVENL